MDEMSKQNTLIHATAVVHPGAVIEEGVHIGPYCIIGKNITLKKGVKLHAHVYIDGVTTVGENTTIFPFAVIGTQPQDRKYAGEKSKTIIGKNNVIREHVTIHGGTNHGVLETIVGDNCLLMVGSHVAHDCIVGNNVIMSNNATLGGHVIIEDNVTIGGLAAIHQFVRIGQHAIIGGVSAVVDDVVPYASAAGDRAKLLGVNTRGLRRNGFDNKDITIIQEAYDILFKEKNGEFLSRIKKLKNVYSNNEKISAIISFLNGNKVRPICTTMVYEGKKSDT